MKVLIPIVIGLLVVGCGEKQSTNTNDGNNTPEKPAKKRVGKETPSKGDENNSTTAKLVKELTPEEQKVVGEYESKIDGNTERIVFLDNGISEAYDNGKKEEGEVKWKLTKEGEIHVTIPHEKIIVVSRINKDGSITYIADIKEGRRIDLPKDFQITHKKIK